MTFLSISVSGEVSSVATSSLPGSQDPSQLEAGLLPDFADPSSVKMPTAEHTLQTFDPYINEMIAAVDADPLYRRELYPIQCRIYTFADSAVVTEKQLRHSKLWLQFALNELVRMSKEWGYAANPSPVAVDSIVIRDPVMTESDYINGPWKSGRANKFSAFGNQTHAEWEKSLAVAQDPSDGSSRSRVNVILLQNENAGKPVGEAWNKGYPSGTGGGVRGSGNISYNSEILDPRLPDYHSVSDIDLDDPTPISNRTLGRVWRVGGIAHEHGHVNGINHAAGAYDDMMGGRLTHSFPSTYPPGMTVSLMTGGNGTYPNTHLHHAGAIQFLFGGNVIGDIVEVATGVNDPTARQIKIVDGTLQYGMGQNGYPYATGVISWRERGRYSSGPILVYGQTNWTGSQDNERYRETVGFLESPAPLNPVAGNTYQSRFTVSLRDERFFAGEYLPIEVRLKAVTRRGNAIRLTDWTPYT